MIDRICLKKMISYSSTEKTDNTSDEWDERAQVNSEEVIDSIDNDFKFKV